MTARLLIGVALVAMTSITKLTMASGDDYLRSLHEDFLINPDNGTCSQIDVGWGIQCNSTVLLRTNIFGESLVIQGNTTSSWNNISQQFTSSGHFYGSLSNITDIPLLWFEFNSSTPNGTVLSSGRVPIGPLTVKTGNTPWPTIPVLFELSHVAILWRDTDVACDPNTPCDKAKVAGTLGLSAIGQEITSLSQVQFNITEPNAANFSFPFENHVNSTTFCENQTYAIDYQDAIKAQLKVCNGDSPCYYEEASFPVKDFNGTIAENVCVGQEGP
jgi:hypothetical protein